MATRVPAIPEIAKAFENDPRTKLALQAIAGGTTTSPVAQGKYAWADGLARVLQAGIGGYQQNKQLDRYAQDEQALLDLRRQRGEQGLAGLNGAPPQAAPQAPAPPPQAAPIAAALGAPPAPQEAPQATPVAPPLPVASQPLPALPPQGVAFTDPLGGRGRQTGGYGDARPGHTHNGLDLATPAGTPVAAAADGTVIRAWNDTKNGGGNSVLVRHPDGSITGYAHLADIGVKRGDTVAGGQPIGAAGSTGRSTGSHLHFTYRDPTGKRQDPSKINFGQPTAQTGDPTPVAARVTNAGGVPVEPMPTAPQVEGPTQSGRLRAAYQQMADANRYESAGAMDMMDRGLGEQGDFNERAAGRRQDVANTGYQSALQRYGADRTQMRGINADVAQQERAFGHDDATQTRSFAHDMEKAGYDRQTSLMLAQVNNDAGWKRQQATIDAARGTAEQKAEAKRAGFFNTATGSKLFETSGAQIQANQDALDQVQRFKELNAKRSTGGMLLSSPAAGLETWRDGDLQAMDGISQSLRIALSKAIPGAISDKEGDAILKSILTTKVGKRANDFAAQRIEAALNRSNDYQTHKLEAMAAGQQVPFIQKWSAYRDSIPVTDPVTFDEWLSKMPKYGADGKRIN